MKRIQQLFILAIFLSLIITACSTSDSGDKFLGNWVRGDSKDYQLTITKAGAAWYSIVESPPVQGYGRWTATYEKGNLVNSTMVGIIISYSNGKIIYEGSEYEKSN